ncbi:hypothetical protein A73_24 [Escherichia phage A73]|uniref:Uncharacterized protein n=1 Tax=Escherichia phage A73 TaxID=3003819 RepID=A0AAF0APY9_9CAUD|nr:hypothetical protein A73_24 [Escherichia phage A73]
MKLMYIFSIMDAISFLNYFLIIFTAWIVSQEEGSTMSNWLTLTFISSLEAVAVIERVTLA